MLSPQIAFEANNVHRSLDQPIGTRRRRGRNLLLGQGLQAAHRALDQLAREPLVNSTRAYVIETLARHELNPYAVAEEIRVDRETIRYFVAAECRLLRADGYDSRLIDVFERDMFAVLDQPLRELPESMADQVAGLRTRIEQDIESLQKGNERASAHRDLAAVLGLLGGCAVVAADTAAAAATTGLLSPVLAASGPIGAEMVSQAVAELAD